MLIGWIVIEYHHIFLNLKNNSFLHQTLIFVHKSFSLVVIDRFWVIKWKWRRLRLPIVYFFYLHILHVISSSFWYKTQSLNFFSVFLFLWKSAIYEFLMSSVHLNWLIIVQSTTLLMWLHLCLFCSLAYSIRKKHNLSNNQI